MPLLVLIPHLAPHASVLASVRLLTFAITNLKVALAAELAQMGALVPIGTLAGSRNRASLGVENGLVAVQALELILWVVLRLWRTEQVRRRHSGLCLLIASTSAPCRSVVMIGAKGVVVDDSPPLHVGDRSGDGNSRIVVKGGRSRFFVVVKVLVYTGCHRC
jgi:hypothetical protein